MGSVAIAHADVVTGSLTYTEGDPIDWSGGNTCGWAIYTSADGYNTNLLMGHSGVVSSSGSDLLASATPYFDGTPASYRLICLQDGNCTGDYANCDAVNSGMPTPWEARFEVVAATGGGTSDTSATSSVDQIHDNYFHSIMIFLTMFFGTVWLLRKH